MDVAQEAPDTVFLAGDEAGVYLQVTTCDVWSPTGQTPIGRADPGRARTNFHGVLNLQTGQESAMRSDLMNAEVSAQYLELCLEAEPQAKAFFESLASFYRNTYIKWIESAKRPETRTARISEMIELLKAGRKQK